MSKRARSPVLGYNHNLRYGGRTFHVQTEDSGQGYARLYTHLFFEGTILSSKKQEYDPEAPEDSVRALMQQLHKAMIRELTRAEHDARIAAFFTARGEPAMLEERRAPAAAAGPTPTEPPVAAVTSMAPAVEVVAAGVVAPAPASAPTPLAASAPVSAPAAPRPNVTPKPVVIVQPHTLTRSPVQVSSAADGVVVRRNVVINVGAGQPPVKSPASNGTPAPAVPAPAAVAAKPRGAAGGGNYAVRDGGGFVAGTRARATAPAGGAQAQPLASSREIRMPWETPAPTRISQPVMPVVAAPAEPAAAPNGKIRMPWDPPAAVASEPFSGDLISDKSLDEVILEYLADDGEAEER